MKIDRVAIGELHEDPANVRKHSPRNLDAIKASLARFGQQKPIVIDEKNVVRAGNGALAAAKALGWQAVDCVRSDLSGVDATAYAIADNRTAELAEWDDDALAETLKAIQCDPTIDSTATGFTDNEICELIERLDSELLDEEESLPDIDTATSHVITMRYDDEEEAAILAFIGEARGPLNPQAGKQILGRIKEIAQNRAGR